MACRSFTWVFFEHRYTEQSRAQNKRSNPLQSASRGLEGFGVGVQGQ